MNTVTKRVVDKQLRLTATPNYSKRTYTIRRYEGGKVLDKYRTYPQSEPLTPCLTENDIRNILRGQDYYLVR